jgi:hypothetical protein
MLQDIAAKIAFSPSSLNLVTVLGATDTARILSWRWWKQKMFTNL